MSVTALVLTALMSPVDTSAVYAVLDRDDENHPEARETCVVCARLH
jgi:predicted nucleic acid-binding protein